MLLTNYRLLTIRYHTATPLWLKGGEELWRKKQLEN